jgi:ATP synthase protein I
MAKPPGRRKALADSIGDKATRRRRARTRPDRGLWFGLGMFGLVGWAVAVPTLLGIAAGIWLDRLWPGRLSWTLTLLFVGVVAGCMNAWYWIERERKGSDHDR